MSDNLLFPHDSIRKTQDQVIQDIQGALQDGKHMVLHAPTGIGKTVSVLAPVLPYALKNGYTIFFLTSRQTQHAIAIQTLKDIKKKFGNKINVVDLIGKRSMCLQNVDGLPPQDFLDFCKKSRERDECEHFVNTRKKTRLPTVQAEASLVDLKEQSPLHVKELIEFCERPKLCPYEMATMQAEGANVIIADYNYIFAPIIRDSLFSRAKLHLENCIVVVDEGHNLPMRARDLLTAKLTSNMIDRAMKEANKYKFFDCLIQLTAVKDALESLGDDLNFNTEEKTIRKSDFMDKISHDYDGMISSFTIIGDEIKEKQKQSYIAGLAKFLDAWQGSDAGFARILSKDDETKELELNYSCLDPSHLTRDVIDRVKHCILMSGTLQPTEMYRELLGFPDDTVQRTYDNPFPKENRLNLVIPETTTKYSRRSDSEYKHIAAVCNQIIETVNKNTAVFFPSYFMRDKVYKFLYEISNRPFFVEKQGMTKTEKEIVLGEFVGLKDTGAVLLAVSAGSFGEGVDFPGDLLSAVIVVGLPLEKPNLETKELIEYYQDMYGKGLDYGYFFPAFTKCLQNAGRCIRSETDKGVIAFVDERFAWENYLRCFPKDLDIKISKQYESRIKEFFN